MKLPLYIFYPFKFSKADGLFSRIAPTVWQVSKSGQSPQVETPLFNAHFRIPHRLSQNTVFAPFIRQPSQLICSGRIGALFSAAHSFAVFSRKTWSSLAVALYASHFSQSSPQYRKKIADRKGFPLRPAALHYFRSSTAKVSTW